MNWTRLFFSTIFFVLSGQVLAQEASPEPELICISHRGLYAVYNQSDDFYVDRYFQKRKFQCQLSINGSSHNLLCAASRRDYFALRDVSSLEYLGSRYSQLSFDDCMDSLRWIVDNRVCVADENGKFARYDLEKKRFIDFQHSLSFDQCIVQLPL